MEKEKQEAVKLLIQVAFAAQKGGLLSLQDAATVLSAIQILSEDFKQEETATTEA